MYRTAIRLGIGAALVGRSTAGCRLHQTDDQRLHLQLAAQTTLQTQLDLALDAHPVHVRGVAAAVARELLPAVLQHPGDLTLGPEAELAGIGGRDDAAQVHPRRSGHHPVGADHRQHRDHAVFRQLLALLEHPGIDDAVAGRIEQLDAGLHRLALTDRIGGEFHHITVVDDQGVLHGDAHGVTRFGVGHEHAVLAVHGHEVLGLGESQHQLLVFLEAVARHVNAFALAVDHLRPKHHQPVDGVHHGDGVAGDRTGGEDDRVGALHLHLGVFTAGDAAQGGEGFALAAGHQQQGFAIGQITDLLDRHEQIIRSAHVAELACLGDHIQHRTAQQAHFAAVLEGELKNHRHPMDRAGEGGDDHPAFRLGDVAIQAGEHRALWRAEAGDFSVGGIAEQAEHALLAVVGEASHVKGFAVHRCVVKLEVAGEDHRPHWCGDGQREAVRHRVGVADELDGEVLPHLHHIPRRNGLQDGAIHHTSFLHLAGEHGQRQAWAVNHGDIEVLEVVGNATDVIFVTVGHDHAADAILVFLEIAGIRHHHVDAVHAVAGEGQTGIHQHDVVAVFEHASVLTDLVQAAERNHTQAGLAGSAVAVAAVAADGLNSHSGRGCRRRRPENEKMWLKREQSAGR